MLQEFTKRNCEQLFGLRRGRHVRNQKILLNAKCERRTVATQSFRTAERSLWENGFFENSPKIKFSSDENDFWTGGS